MSLITGKKAGFTLVELLLVIGILAILVFVVLSAINPRRQLGQARNAQRQSDMQSIIEALSHYTIDTGYQPTGLTQGMANAKPICQFDMSVADCDALNGIHLRMLSGSYLPTMPHDPLILTTGTGTRYNIYRNDNGRILLQATGAEDGKTITTAR